jgi:TolB-like protein/Tfp pilus assembly protein PilF/tRNA A-37 threonylcarbamoyl transferase component Bud32
VTPDRWKQVKGVLGAALDRPAEERGALVEAACAGDAELRTEVESLLASAGAAHEFLETAARPALLRPPAEGRPEARAGARIGPYRVLSEIGRGGMGAVYLAERDDQEYRKQVAIKLVRGDADSASVVRRFRQERQILAELDHPNIARLLDGGTTDEGLPYFVMEYVEGAPIDAYCEARKLTVKGRLELFRTVCAAIGDAHRKRVVHRDLKPSNILVTAEGTPKLVDFGIAKLMTPTSGSEHTATGTHLMTPEYGSPEQWRGGPVTAASDIYSLGVLLYRLLTGQSPYRAGPDQPHELGRAICEEDPAPPSAAAAAPTRHQLAGDLDAIVLKAMRKEPERRYGSAAELSEDIRRHLEGLPVAARKDGIVYRAGRLVRRNRAVGLTVLTMAAMAILVSALVYRWARVPGPRAPAGPAGAITSLAVLPLTNLSRDPEQEYFADGMTEALITDLSQIGSLRVVSRTSIMRYKGTARPVPEVAGELNVDGVVEGSVLRSGNRVRITAQLIRASDDRHLWAQSYEREMSDILSLQGTVAEAIAGEIKGRLTAQEQARLTSRPPVNPRAYLAYVRGRYFWNKRNEESLKTATTYFEEALREDPGYARAYSGLADSYFYRGYAFGRAVPREAMPKAKAAALKALALDDTMAEAHTSLGMVRFFYDWDWPGAAIEFRRAIELDPNYATAHHVYAAFLSITGRHDESVAEARRALEVDPLSLPVNQMLGLVLRRAGRYDEAIEQYRKTLELDPSFAMAVENLGIAYAGKGLAQQAVEAFLKADALAGKDPAQLRALRRAYEQRGMPGFREEGARATVAAGWDGWHWVTPQIAEAYAILGRRDEAMTWLEKAYAARSASLLWIDPDWPEMRSDPRFQDLLRRIGLPRRHE